MDKGAEMWIAMCMPVLLISQRPSRVKHAELLDTLKNISIDEKDRQKIILTPKTVIKIDGELSYTF